MSHDKRISKLLSLALRHQPEKLGLTLDEQGYVHVNGLRLALARHGHAVTLEGLKRLVAENDKQRFEFSADCLRIRARQGHSVEVDLGLEPMEPPAVLYHGTASQVLESIKTQGLLKMRRQHVHLSASVEVARKVGARHGSPLVLDVDAFAMHAVSHIFYLAGNGVWLTDHVPAAFLKIPT